MPGLNLSSCVLFVSFVQAALGPLNIPIREICPGKELLYILLEEIEDQNKSDIRL